MRNSLKTIIALLLCAALCLPLAACSEKAAEYETAVSVYKEGRYADAAERFGALDGYRDSNKYSAKCSLISDPDSYIDGFAQAFGEYLADEHPGLKLIEAEGAPRAEGHRAFQLVPTDTKAADSRQNYVLISFIRVDSSGNIWGDGQVNAVMTFCNPDGGEDGYPEDFITGAVGAYRVFAGGKDAGRYEKELRSKLSKALADLGGEQPVSRSEEGKDGFVIHTVASKDSGGTGLGEIISCD